MAKHSNRLSVWTFREAPKSQRASLRKSDSYCCAEVAAHRASWVRDERGLIVGIQTFSPERIARHQRENKIPSLGGNPAISPHEAHLNANSRGKAVIGSEDEREHELLLLNDRIEDSIDRALDDGRHVPYRVFELNARAKVMATPIVNETHHGARATMVAVGICPA